MATSPDLADRDAFLERMRVQLQARYRDLTVTADAGRWGLHLTGAGIDVRLPLTPLHHAVLREPSRAGSLIAAFVRSAETRLTPTVPLQLSLSRTLWCLRTEDYLEEHSRRGDLLLRPLAGALVAFVAEELPNAIMRGIGREEWEALGDAEVAAAADRNTTARFARLPQRILDADRVPRDGWSFGGDSLYQGSMLLVPEVLAALAARAGGDVLVATPDRGQVIAIPAASADTVAFQRRVVRSWREAAAPCSRQVAVTDGRTVTAVATGPAPRPVAPGGLLRRLRR